MLLWASITFSHQECHNYDNINEHVLGQEGRKLNDPYTFVDKEEFNARFGPRGKVHFVQLLTSEGYWEGLHFKPSQEFLVMTFFILHIKIL